MNEIDPILIKLIQLIDKRFEKLATTFSSNYLKYNEKSIFPRSNLSESWLRKPNSISLKTEGIRVFKSKPLLLSDLISTVIFLVGNCKVAFPKPVIDCIIRVYF